MRNQRPLPTHLARRALAASLGLLCVTLAGAHGAQAATYVIRSDGSGDLPTIQAALDVAADGDSVLLADGVFTGAGNRDLNFLGRAVHLGALSGSRENCVIDCEGSLSQPHRAFDFSAGEGPESVIENLTIVNGCANGECCEDLTGGAIRCQFASSPTIRGCLFLANLAVTDGGAILCANYSAPVIQDCAFLENRAAVGGAIACGGFANAVISGCTFRANVASDPGSGGALLIKTYSDVLISDCTFYANRGDNGSAIYCAFWSAPQISNTIIAAGEIGPAVFVFETTPLLTCCDLYGNEGGDWVGGIADQYGVNGNISADPVFCDPLAGNLTLHAGSPCLPGADPECGLIGAWPIGCPGTDVAEPPALAATELHVCPNPFSASTTIAWSAPLEGAGTIHAAIHDAAGRRIRDLAAHGAPGARPAVRWDGTDLHGHAVPGGVYFLHARAGERRVSRALILLR